MKKLTVLLIILTLVFAVGCQKKISIRNDYNVGLPMETINPDPLNNEDESRLIHSLLYSSLIEIKKDNTIIMDLAKSMIVEQGIFTFELEKNILFHDGTPLTTEDVKATYLNLMERDNHDLGMIKDIRVINESIIQFHLINPYFPFVFNLDKPILPKGLIDQRHDFSREPIGSGPFKYKGWDDNTLILEVNEDYYGKKPEIKVVSIKGIPDYRKRLVDLEVGKLDFALNLPMESALSINKENTVSLGRYRNSGMSIVAINFENSFFKDTQVRRLIASNLNFDLFFNQLSKDVEILETILNLGYVHGFELTMVIPDEDTLMKDIGLELKRQLQSMGIELRLSYKDKKNFAEILEGKKADMFFTISGKETSLYSAMNSLGEEFYGMIHQDNQLEEISKKINNSKTLEEYASHMEDFNNILERDIPFIKVYPNIRYFGYHQDIKGIEDTQDESFKDMLLKAYWSR